MQQEINDRLERIGSSMIYDIVANGGHEAYEKLVLKIPTPPNDYMERGVRLELPMMEWAADANGWEFTKADTVRWEQDGVLYRDTPDFWIGDVLAEGKTHNMWIRDQYGDEFSDVVPDRVYCQAQFHMAANKAEECRVVASFGGEKPEVFIVRFDEKVWKGIHADCAKFWHQHVVPGIPPKANGSDASTNLLNQIPRVNEDFIEANDKDLEKHRQLETIKGEIKALTADKNELQNYFKERIGESTGIQNGSLRYTWKANKPKVVIDYKALVAELAPDPELLEKYTTEITGSRVLRAGKPKVK